jgi:hypothetical protein
MILLLWLVGHLHTKGRWASNSHRKCRVDFMIREKSRGILQYQDTMDLQRFWFFPQLEGHSSQTAGRTLCNSSYTTRSPKEAAHFSPSHGRSRFLTGRGRNYAISQYRQKAGQARLVDQAFSLWSCTCRSAVSLVSDHRADVGCFSACERGTHASHRAFRLPAVFQPTISAASVHGSAHRGD